jgi:hypothetical protein
MDLDSYFHNRIHRWAGYVTGMSMIWAPRHLLTGWIALSRTPRQLLITDLVAHSRPNECPETTWRRALEKAFVCRGLPINIKEWREKLRMTGRSGGRGHTQSLCAFS